MKRPESVGRDPHVTEHEAQNGRGVGVGLRALPPSRSLFPCSLTYTADNQKTYLVLVACICRYVYRLYCLSARGTR